MTKFFDIMSKQNDVIVDITVLNNPNKVDHDYFRTETL